MKPDIIREALLRFQELAEAEGGTAYPPPRQQANDRNLARLALKKYQKTQGWRHQQNKVTREATPNVGDLLASLRS